MFSAFSLHTSALVSAFRHQPSDIARRCKKLDQQISEGK